MKKPFIICIALLMIGCLTAYAQSENKDTTVYFKGKQMVVSDNPQPKSAEVLNLELQILQEQKKTAETEIARLNEALGRIQLQFQAQALLTSQSLEKINTQIVEKTKEIEALTEKTQEPQQE